MVVSEVHSREHLLEKVQVGEEGEVMSVYLATVAVRCSGPVPEFI